MALVIAIVLPALFQEHKVYVEKKDTRAAFDDERGLLNNGNKLIDQFQAPAL